MENTEYPKYYYSKPEGKAVKLISNDLFVYFQIHKNPATEEETLGYKKGIINTALLEELKSFVQCADTQYKETALMYYLKNKEYHDKAKNTLLKDFSIFTT